MKNALAVSLLAAATATAVLGSAGGVHAGTAASGFTPGELVVYRVGTGGPALLSSAATAAFLDEYPQAGAAVPDFSVGLPTAVSGSNKRLTASGTSTSEGELTLSGNGQILTATGYNAATGTANVSGTAAASTPRTVALVRADGSVDTSTALTDFADGNNPRSAVTNDGTNIWVGGAAGGVRYATPGSTTSTALTSATYKNVRQLGIVGGQLYTSADPTKASITVAKVGTGLPTSGSSNAVTNLAFSSSPSDPYGYASATLGTGTTPDTLYVADSNAGKIEKYGLVSGTWTAQGSVALAGVTGIAAQDVGGTVHLFATTPGTTNADKSVTGSALYALSDAAGLGGALTGSPTAVAVAPTNEAFRGLAFAPGTSFGTGSPPPAVVPTITTAHSGLPAQLDDPTNPSLGITVGDANYPDGSGLSVTASAADQSIATATTVNGSGNSRTLTVTPGAVGRTTITITVTAPDGQSTATSVAYGVSPDEGDASDRYYSGSGNASAAVDVGGGYMLVADDENNVIRLYDETRSGPPVKSFDFTAQLPFGTAEADFEGAARAGNRVYFEGSMSNTSSGDLAPARSTLFAADISGSGASTTLTYVGAYTGLQSDLVSWDEANGNRFGFNASVNGGVDGHETDAFNVEGLEFAPGSTSTAYLGFRAPLEPTSNRTQALVVPVTNIDQLVTGAATTATFGNPLQWNLGGLGIRDLKANAAGQYLVIAGTADDTNTDFELYSWDGVATDPPLRSATLPQVPSSTDHGSWETVVAVPSPLVSGASVTLLQDDGDEAWYADGATSKTKPPLPLDLQKDLGRTFAFTAPSPAASTTAVSSSDPDATAGESLTFTASVPSTGTVDFTVGSTTLCSSVPVSGGVASCDYAPGSAGTFTVTATYSGNATYAASSGTVDQTVGQGTSTTSVVADTDPAVTGQDVTFAATVTAPVIPTGAVDFTAGSTTLCAAVPVQNGQADCTVAFPAGTYDVVANYGGSGDVGSSSGDARETVDLASTSTALSSSDGTPVAGESLALSATIAATAPGSAARVTPGGTVTFTEGATTLCQATLSPTDATSTAGCSYAFEAGSHTVVATYSGDGNFASSQDTETLTVGQDATTTTVSVPNGVTGQSLTISAQVSANAPGAGTPGGSVSFTAGGGPLTGCQGIAVDAAGDASCTTSFAVGTHAVTAAASGDNSYAASTGSASTTVTAAATTATVTTSTPAVVSGQQLTLVAQVQPVAPGSAATITPGGTVSFMAGGSPVPGCGSVPLAADGSAQCTVTAPAAPLSTSITAQYSGDVNFAASTSSSQPVTVSAAATSTSVAVSPAAPAGGQQVTLTAAVASQQPGSGTPAGTVTWTLSGGLACRGGDSIALSAGVAACVVPAGQTVGGQTYTVSAAYKGTAAFKTSKVTVSGTVGKTVTVTTLSGTPNPSAVGQSVTVTATVAAQPASAGIPGGRLAFTLTDASGRTKGSATVTMDSSGSAVVTIPASLLPRAGGPYTVTAAYEGSSVYGTSRASYQQSVS